MLETIAALLMFAIECYHIVGHCIILFRVRLLPRKDLVRVRLYFAADTLSVFVVSVIFTGRLRWLAAIQIAQHMYYIVFWDQTPRAQKIVTWSSLDWFQSKLRHRWELDSILGTAFDVAVHMCMSYILLDYLTTGQVLASLGFVAVASYAVLFGPYFAWSNPSRIPPWVQKRIHPERIPS